MIVITHQESLLRLVNRVYRVKDGRMDEIVGGERIS
jgi:ABC-type lipoprotein export system ATPase subunit